MGCEGFDYAAGVPDDEDDEDDELEASGGQASLPPYHEEDPEEVARTLVRRYVVGESLELVANDET